MVQSNILCKNEKLSDEQYGLYDTRIKNRNLLSTYLVGRIEYSDELVEGGIYHKGDILLKILFLGISYEYSCFGDVRVAKTYCKNGSIVDYNKPILLMERMEI